MLSEQQLSTTKQKTKNNKNRTAFEKKFFTIVLTKKQKKLSTNVS